MALFARLWLHGDSLNELGAYLSSFLVPGLVDESVGSLSEFVQLYVAVKLVLALHLSLNY